MENDVYFEKENVVGRITVTGMPMSVLWHVLKVTYKTLKLKTAKIQEKDIYSSRTQEIHFLITKRTFLYGKEPRGRTGLPGLYDRSSSECIDSEWRVLL